MNPAALNVMTDRLIYAALEQRGFVIVRYLPSPWQWWWKLPEADKSDEAYYVVRAIDMLGFVYRIGPRWYAVARRYPTHQVVALGAPQPTRLLALQGFPEVKQALLE